LRSGHPAGCDAERGCGRRRFEPCTRGLRTVRDLCRGARTAVEGTQARPPGTGETLSVHSKRIEWVARGVNILHLVYDEKFVMFAAELFEACHDTRNLFLVLVHDHRAPLKYVSGL